MKQRILAHWPWVASALSGVMLGLSYPPWDWGGLVWLALAPLAAAVWLGPWRGVRQYAFGGFVAGAFYFGMSLFWLTTLTAPGWLLLALYLALYPTVWAVFLGVILRPSTDEQWLSSWRNLGICAAGAAVWVGLEWLRGIVFTGFGWNALAVALHSNIPLIQIADIAGTGGISFLIVMASLMAVATVQRLRLEIGRGARRPHYDFAVTVALIALAWGYGIRQLFAPPGESVDVRFAAVQANIPQQTRNDPRLEAEVMAALKKHTELAMAADPDIILWPESATPRPLFNDQAMWDQVSGMARRFDGDFFLGTVFFSEQGDYNSVVLLSDRAQAAQIYHKMHLVPFGEYVPMRRAFPLFAWIVGDLVPDDFDAGEKVEVFSMRSPAVELGPLICFEDTLGYLARKSALAGAQAFVVATNDGWFLESAGSLQHLNNALFRCVENKLPMLRAANTGVTCWIDSKGVVRETLRDEATGSTFVDGFLLGTMRVPTAPQPTFYALNGDLFSHACLAASLLLAFRWTMRRRKSASLSTCPNPEEKKS